MTRNFRIASLFSPAALLLASCGVAYSGESMAHSVQGEADAAEAPFTITEVATIEEPWALAFEPGTGNLFVTGKRSALTIVAPDGSTRSVSGTPEVDYGGQGGFGDIAFSPDYAETKALYLSWVEAGEADKRGAVVGRGTLACDDAGACAIEGLEIIWRQLPKQEKRGHFSHRIAFSPDGEYLFISSGERMMGAPAQDLSNNLGSVVRLNLDGSPAAGNPFADTEGANPEIWSYGHRNLVGLGFDANGQLWDVEHGPRGGDEINKVEPGVNYGWPLVSDGDNYDGTPIKKHHTMPEFQAPAISWNPVIAPGDFLFYRGDLFAGWKGEALITGLGKKLLVRVKIDEDDKGHEIARYDMDGRVRDIIEAADGSLLVIIEAKEGKLLRLTPKPAAAGGEAETGS